MERQEFLGHVVQSEIAISLQSNTNLCNETQRSIWQTITRDFALGEMIEIGGLVWLCKVQMCIAPMNEIQGDYPYAPATYAAVETSV